MALADRIVSACRRLRDLTAPESDQDQCGAQIAAALFELERVSMTTDLLRTTKAGKIVNAARSRLENRLLRDRAKKLITIWKDAVAKPCEEPALKRPESMITIAEPLQSAGRVLHLQSLCLNVLRQNSSRLGRLDCVLPTPILLMIAQNAKVYDLIRLEKLNPEIAPDLDICWRRIARLDLPDQYAAVVDADSMPMSFWRDFYKNVLAERDKKEQEYAERLAQKQQQAESAKQQASVKRLKPSAVIVKKTLIRARDEPNAKTTPKLAPARGNGRLSKILEPARKRLKMEKRFKR